MSQRVATREVFEEFVRTKLVASRAIDLLFELVDELTEEIAELSGGGQTAEYFLETTLMGIFDAKRFKELLTVEN